MSSFDLTIIALGIIYYGVSLTNKLHSLRMAVGDDLTSLLKKSDSLHDSLEGLERQFQILRSEISDLHARPPNSYPQRLCLAQST
jgi:hypothetical protein